MLKKLSHNSSSIPSNYAIWEREATSLILFVILFWKSFLGGTWPTSPKKPLFHLHHGSIDISQAKNLTIEVEQNPHYTKQLY
jgi:hypothetical protein